MIIQQRKREDLGIVDPICQSRALLGKLIVCGLLPRDEPWKEFLLSRIRTRTLISMALGSLALMDFCRDEVPRFWPRL